MISWKITLGVIIGIYANISVNPPFRLQVTRYQISTIRTSTKGHDIKNITKPTTPKIIKSFKVSAVKPVIYKKSSPPSIMVIGSPIICEGKRAILKASGGDTYTWFKDGQPLKETGNRLVVTESGNFWVRRISNEGDQSATSKTITITVYPKPQKPVVYGRFEGCDGDIINLAVDDQLEGKVKFEWHRQMESKPFAIGREVQYIINGDAEIYVTAVSQSGCVSDEIETVTIRSTSPKGDIEISKSNIVFGEMVTFKPNIRNARIFEWDFGDGLKSYEESPRHYYNQPGSFTVTLKTYSDTGCEYNITGKTKVTVAREVLPDPVPNIPTPDNGMDASPQEWRFGPNPIGDRINIFFHSENIERVKIEVVSLDGTVVHTEMITSVTGRNSFGIHGLNRLASGHYILRIKSKNLRRSENIIKL